MTLRGGLCPCTLLHVDGCEPLLCKRVFVLKLERYSVDLGRSSILILRLDI